MRTILFVLASTLLFSACRTSKPSVAPPITKVPSVPPISLDSVVTAVQDQYVKALKKLAADSITNVEISSLEIILKVTKSTEADGEIKVLIFKPSATFGQTRSTTVTYVLSKEESQLGAGKGLVKGDDLSDAIYKSAKNFNSLASTVGGLVKDNFSLDIAFSVKRVLGLGLEFDLWGISADIGAQTENEVEHGLTLAFKLKKP